MMADHSSMIPLLHHLLLWVVEVIHQLLDAEGGVALVGGLGDQVGVEDAVAREAVCDAEEDEDGGAEVHFHRRREGEGGC